MNSKYLTRLSYEISNRLFNFIGNLLTKEWDARLLGLSKLPIATIIDVGANDGQFAKKISKIFPQASIYAFEPLTEPFKKLENWAVRHNGRVTVFNVALGDAVQEIQIHNHLYFHPASSILATTQLCERIYPMLSKQETLTIQQSTLDRELSHLPHPLHPDILIKLDVQGYEDRVIRGGRETFKKATACIVEIALDRLYENQAEFRDIFILMDSLGYRYAGNLDQICAKDGHVRYLNAIFLK